jgi:putative tricarboxylic transport membrane protein
MRKIDRFGGMFWLGLGIVISALSSRLGLGNLHKPGPGFAPLLAGAILTLLGLILTLSTYSKQFVDEKTISILVKKGRKDSFLALSALLGYILLLEPLGFLTTTFIFLVVLFKIKEKKRWVIPLVLSLSTVVVSYLIFSVWLRLEFPKGPLGF